MASTHLKLFYPVMATTSLLFGESVEMAERSRWGCWEVIARGSQPSGRR